MKSLASALAVLILCAAALPAGAKIVHRWSFASDGRDSAGTANATLQEGATVANGRADLNGQGAFVALPIGATIAGLSNTTIEVWATWDQVQGPWARIFDLGSGQAAYMFLTPRHGRAEGGSPEDSIRFAITNDGFGAEQQVNGPTQFPTGAETHVAVTIDAAADVAKLYVNGKLVATKEGVTLSPADLGNTSNNWLGAGQYFETDPSFDGSISEFRIHDTALSAEEVARSHQLGPDKLVPDAPPGQPTMAAASAGGAIGGCCQPDPCCERSHRRGSGRLFGGRFGRRCR